MWETLIFNNKNKSLCTTVSMCVCGWIGIVCDGKVYICLLNWRSGSSWVPLITLESSSLTLTSRGHEIGTHCETSLSALLFRGNLAPSSRWFMMFSALRLRSLDGRRAAPAAAISTNTHWWFWSWEIQRAFDKFWKALESIRGWSWGHVRL